MDNWMKELPGWERALNKNDVTFGNKILEEIEESRKKHNYL